MINNPIRNGNFNSSEICALMTNARSKDAEWSEAAMTFIEETNYERMLGRAITDEVQARPLSWGNLVENRVFNLLGPEYILTSQQTDQHPEVPYWVGSKDGYKNDEGLTVFDIKSPITLTSFCRLVAPLVVGKEGMDAMDAIRNGYTVDGATFKKHKDGEKFYWQLVSNACIMGAKYAELIPYMPYKAELDDIRLMAMNSEGADMAKYSWISFAREDELPFIKEGGVFRNLNKIRFEVPKKDKDLLEMKVRKAGKLLVSR
jgi:hypothetical protein